jgi:SAM-dependent methyltransferase
MRVLDVGSGAGDVAFLVADLIGPTGSVTGVDLVPDAVTAATEAAAARGIQNVRFVEGDPAVMRFAEPFDAVVGRYVLLFCPDRAAMLRNLSSHTRRGGVLAFHEPDWSFTRSTPPVGAYDRACTWIVDVNRRAGAPWEMAGNVHEAFLDAGLGAPSMRMQALFGTSPQVDDFVRSVADIVRILLPAIEQSGIASRVDVDVETLGERMMREIEAERSVIVGRAEVGAWSRV